MSSHACGHLTDLVIERAVSGARPRRRPAVLPRCGGVRTGGLEGWTDPALAIDIVRATRLEAQAYRIWTQAIPEAITPKNRLLLAAPATGRNHRSSEHDDRGRRTRAFRSVCAERRRDAAAAGVAARGAAPHRPGHRAGLVDRRLRRADRDDDARRAGGLRGAVDHPRRAARSSRSSRPSSGATRSSPARPGLEGFNRVPGPRAGVSWLVWAWAVDGVADAAAGRRDVRRRRPGAAPARARRSA